MVLHQFEQLQLCPFYHKRDVFVFMVLSSRQAYRQAKLSFRKTSNKSGFILLLTKFSWGQELTFRKINNRLQLTMTAI